MRARSTMVLLALPAVVGIATPAGASAAIKIDGYLEYRKGSWLIVDAQRVQATPKTKWRGARARNPDDIPLGYEIRAKVRRREDGTLVAAEIEAHRNGSSFLEEEVLEGTNQAEQAYVKARKVYDAGPDGKERVIGTLQDSGPQVDRARRIVDRILPAYVDPKKVRVYVVDNKEWNAMAMANYSIYVFSGLMADLDDDELAIVLGHEIAHATHEHSRRQAKKGLIGGLAGAAASAGAEMIDSDLARSAAQKAAALGVITFGNVYSREHEDQADRVGLRYVYEGGYDVRKAPRLWRRFAEKYGDQDKISNFFFGDHSLSTKRAAALEREIARNYSDPRKDPPSRAPGAAS